MKPKQYFSAVTCCLGSASLNCKTLLDVNNETKERKILLVSPAIDFVQKLFLALLCYTILRVIYVAKPVLIKSCFECSIYPFESFRKQL